jgi:hypothetical protein
MLDPLEHQVVTQEDAGLKGYGQRANDQPKASRVIRGATGLFGLSSGRQCLARQMILAPGAQNRMPGSVAWPM